MHAPTFRTYLWRGFWRRLSLVACCVLLARCGSSPSAPSSDGAATITLTAAGLVPTEVRISVGGRVLFVNSDARPHAMS